MTNWSVWSCCPQVAGIRTLRARTSCGSETDKVAACVFEAAEKMQKDAAVLEMICYYVGRARWSNLYPPWRRPWHFKGVLTTYWELIRLWDAEGWLLNIMWAKRQDARWGQMQRGDRTAAEPEGDDEYLVKTIYISFWRVNQLEKPIKKMKQNFRGLT